jgi:Fe-Mn family superoxide dismutase
MKYTKKEFTITPSKGMSQKSIDEHLKLYDGYVTNTNKILETMESGSEKGYALMEMRRRYSFEYNGMKNHEYYFEQLEGGTKTMSDSSALMMAINAQWGSIDKWKEEYVELAKTRGVGLAMLTYDK